MAPSSRTSSAGFLVRDVDEEQVLRDGGAQGAAAKLVGQVGCSLQLFAGQAAAQHGCADIAQARLALAVNAGVIAKSLVGHFFGDAGQQREIEARLQFVEEALRPSSLLS